LIDIFLSTSSLLLVQLHMTVSLLGNAYTEMCVHFHMGSPDCTNACLRSGTIIATCPHVEGHTRRAERFN